MTQIDTSKAVLDAHCLHLMQTALYPTRTIELIQALAAERDAAVARAEKAETEKDRLVQGFADRSIKMVEQRHRAEKAETENKAALEEISRTIWCGKTGSVDEIVEAIKEIISATDEIPSLRSRVAALEGAIRGLLNAPTWSDQDPSDLDDDDREAERTARAALSVPSPATVNDPLTVASPATCNDPLQVGAVKDFLTTAAALRDGRFERLDRAAQRGEHISYEPYPGAFDDILGKDEREG